MKNVVLLFIAFFLSGCCTEANYQRILNARIGMDENQLIELVGNPSSVYDTPEKRSLEYNQSSTYCTQYGCFTDWCSTQYMIKDGKVDTWAYRGNSCCAYK